MDVISAVKSASTWNRNNHSPHLSVSAEVVSKRIDVTHHHHADETVAAGVSSSTVYYVTFQVESGKRGQDRVFRQRFRIWYAGGGRYRKTLFSGDEIVIF